MKRCTDVWSLPNVQTCQIIMDINAPIIVIRTDGSKLNKAFSYTWRLWTLPEITELLEEAGFRKVTVYWQGWDEELEEASGDFTPVTKGDADPSWICYITAEK